MSTVSQQFGPSSRVVLPTARRAEVAGVLLWFVNSSHPRQGRALSEVLTTHMRAIGGATTLLHPVILAVQDPRLAL
jgi:hypothetical protein